VRTVAPLFVLSRLSNSRVPLIGEALRDQATGISTPRVAPDNAALSVSGWFAGSGHLPGIGTVATELRWL